MDKKQIIKSYINKYVRTEQDAINLANWREWYISPKQPIYTLLEQVDNIDDKYINYAYSIIMEETQYRFKS